MRDIVAFIEEKNQEFARLPFFEFMKDQNIEPRERLAWVPYAIPFIMCFADLNKYVLRDEQSNEPIQLIINNHTYEDDHHWVWFLEDCKTLGIDQPIQFTDALKFVWGNETEMSRKLIYQLSGYTFQANLVEKLILLEIIEATGNVMLVIACEIGKQIQKTTEKKLLYFGDLHLSVETGHTMRSPGTEDLMQNIQVPEENLQAAYELVEKAFDIFTTFTNDLLIQAQKSTKRQVLTAN
ncbi:hypothetical protein [Nodularia sp. NIES-3585]|uniref:hypothetical protein n=1 Tax=Nodularia sp. NIES-3585 TaxID=1973477 RepID=UPI000B5C9CD3|nr:hypothetical protein [Nodularia sp. NIES-3585]GAX35233.1 hypothetical protein NIES3585_12400 [Nodularia sp. NIES-3585]